LSDQTIIRHPDCVFSFQADLKERKKSSREVRKDQSANSVTKIKKGTMETERNPNEPIKPKGAGQQGGQQGGGGQHGGGSQQEDRDKQERERQQRERENQGGSGQGGGGGKEHGGGQQGGGQQSSRR
jgi:hypothetical protein